MNNDKSTTSLAIIANMKKKEKSYWLKQLSGQPQKSSFPVDYERNDSISWRLETIDFSLPGEIARGLVELSKGSSARLFTFLIAGIFILSRKYTGNKDILLGIPVPGPQRQVELINRALPVRCFVDDALSFLQLLLNLGQTLIEAENNQNFPIRVLSDLLGWPRSSEDGFPLFDMVVLLKNIHQDPLHEFSPNIIVSFERTHQGIEGQFSYNPRRYRPGTIAALIGHFQALLGILLANPRREISGIELLSTEEKHQILVSFNNTAADSPLTTAVHELIDRQAERTPRATAVIYQEHRLSYERLKTKTDLLAAALDLEGVGPGSIVGVLFDHCPGMVITLIGILKTGAAYLPIAPDIPAGRIDYIIMDSHARYIIVQDKHLEINVKYGDRKLPYSRLEQEAASLPPSPLHRPHSPHHPAYIMYTSGSTGKPKGVIIEHKSFIDFTTWAVDEFEHCPGYQVLLSNSYASDGSIQQIFPPLISGGTLHLIDKELRLDPARYLDYLKTHRINNIDEVPVLIKELLASIHPHDREEKLPDLTCLSLGSEYVPIELVRKCRRHLNHQGRIINAYGPAEASVETTTYHCDGTADSEQSLIGKPRRNMRVYILDETGHCCPIGVRGEICISGVGLARGYLNRPELTAEKFDRDLWHYLDYRDEKKNGNYKKFFRGSRGAILQKSPPGRRRLYKTGDRGCWLPDGNIRFLGRIDNQIKIRGYRVELQEIENLLKSRGGIKDAVAVTRENHRGEIEICAYYVPGKGTKPLTRQFFEERLPSYMIPSYLMELEKIPLTPNGKIDKNALPQPAADSTGEYHPPGNHLEKQLVEIWSGVLNRPPGSIGIHTDFFKVGGHSLAVVPLTSMIQKRLEVEIPVTQVFKTPTISGLAQFLQITGKGRYKSIRPVESKEYYDLTPVQKRLYFLQQMYPGSTVYNVPGIIIIDKSVGREKLQEIFRKLIHRHEILRTSYEMLHEEPRQKVHDMVEFEIEYYQAEFKVKVEDSELEGTRGLAPLPIEPAGDIESTEKENYKLQNTNYKQTTNHNLQITNKKERSSTTQYHDPKSQELRAKSYIHSFIRPFDLSRAPLLRVGLIKEEGRKCILAVDMHHIICDPVSHNVLTAEFNRLCSGEALPGLKLQYKDYASWQNSLAQKENVNQQESYWLNLLSGDLPVLELALDFPRPGIQDFEGDWLDFTMKPDDIQGLNDAVKHHYVTPYMFILAVFNILLAKLSGQDDIIVGTPVSTRRHEDIEKMIGMFVNTLALRNEPAGHKTFGDFLQELKTKTLAAYSNADYPFEELVDKIVINRDTSRSPLFDVMFNYLHDTGLPAGAVEEEKNILTRYGKRTSKFDISLTAVKCNDDLLFNIEYCTRLFKRETIARMADYFKMIITAVISHPDHRLAAIEIIPEEEKRRVLLEINDTAADYPGDKSLHGLFEEQAERTPDHIALAEAIPGDGSISNRPRTGVPQQTYRQLNKQSHQLARLLQEKGILADNIVGIMMERSMDLIIGIFGILKASAAYLPIDPAYPRERIDFMLKDSNARVLLTTPKLQVRVKAEVEENAGLPSGLLLPSINIRSINIGTDFESTLKSSFSTLSLTSTCRVGSANLAYIIYTSGSTGKPKGVMIEQRSAVNYIWWAAKCYVRGERVNFPLYTSISFDLTVTSIFTPLLTGNAVVIYGENEADQALLIERIIEDDRVGIVKLTPSHLKMIRRKSICQRTMNLKRFIVGGENLERRLALAVHEFFDGKIQLYNEYGPTEAAVGCMIYKFEPAKNSGASVPIGLPGDNSRVYILDKYRQPAPTGVTGELFLSGAGLARGYLNRPGLTSEKFIIPSSTRNSMGKIFFHLTAGLSNHRLPLYRTGDLARWLPDGMMEFRGRIDLQVKIRGYRIELGEIENRLIKHREVKDAILEIKEDDSGDKSLVAYVVTNREISQLQLREWLLKDLPDYMIPTYFVWLEKIPLTPSGKINRKALPGQEAKKSDGYVSPGNEIEKKLVELWSEILGRDALHKTQLQTSIGIHDNFFQMGGHSLKAIAAANQIQKIFGVKLTIRTLFRNPTIAALAGIIKNSNISGVEEIEPLPEQPHYQMSYAQKRLWYINRGNLHSTAFNMPAKLTFYETVDEKIIKKVLEWLMNRHESLRTFFKETGKGAVQVIEPPSTALSKLNFEVVDLSQFDERERENQRSRIIMSEWSHIFNLEKGPLFRARLVKCSGKEYDFILNIHHIVSDGWSLEVLKKEFFQVYESYKKGIECDSKPLKIQYKDYAHWQNRLLEDEKKMARAKEFWKDYLTDSITPLDLPYDFSTRSLITKRSSAYCFFIEADLGQRLRLLAGKQKGSLFMVLFAAFNILLSHITCQENILTAIPAAARRHWGLRNIIGLFVNTLILQTKVNAGETFSDFLERFQTDTFNVLEYQDYPLEIIFGELKIKYPKVSAFFNMLDIGPGSTEAVKNFDGYHIEEVPETKFDIHCYLTEYKNGIRMECHYFRELFTHETIEKIMRIYTRILENISISPLKKINELPKKTKKLNN